MAGQLWEVVGGGSAGGIIVREGKDTKSKEAPKRLRAGSFIRQVDMAGDRLSFERISGAGPDTGWVSLKFKDKDLVVKTDKTPPPSPVLVCFYSGGMTAPQGRNQLKFLLFQAKKRGLKDSVVLDLVGEEGYTDCKDFDDYTSRLEKALAENPVASGRPIFIVAHSHGSMPAWGLAKRLGARCLKLYVLARRPPSGGLLDEVWGVDSAPKVADIKEDVMFKQMVTAWPNEVFDTMEPPAIKAVMEVVRRQYSSPAIPCGSADSATIVGSDQAIPSPIMALAAEKEQPKGETASKMEGWQDFTSSTFEIKVVPGVTHMEILPGATQLLLDDMLALVP